MKSSARTTEARARAAAEIFAMENMMVSYRKGVSECVVEMKD